MNKPQHMHALDLARKTHEERSAILHGIKDGNRKASDVLLMPQSCMWSIDLVKLLAWQRRWGPAKAKALLRKTFIGENRKLRDLTERQRKILAQHLERKGL